MWRNRKTLMGHFYKPTLSVQNSNWPRSCGRSLSDCHHAWIAHRIVLSTNSFSSLPTSLLNVSTSFQQSSGRRSCILKHVTTSSLALFRSASTCSSFFLCSSFALNCSISLVTLVLLMSCCFFFSARVEEDDVASASFSVKEGSDCWGSSPESVSLNLENSCDPCSRSFSSSAVRRSWYCSSCAFERVASVWSAC